MRSAVTRFAVSCALLLGSSSTALGWGNEGHQAIAEAAQSRLTEKAHAALSKILIGGTSITLPPGKLAAVSTWPDEIRLRKSQGLAAAMWTDADTKEADAFNQAHKSNGGWHFVNLPLGASGYDDPNAVEFKSEDDIVHAINRAIRILESPKPTANYSKAQAVRWLVHLVGDLHQPMHVTTGYYQTTAAALKKPKIIRDPAQALGPGVVGDRGGNGLTFPNQPTSLHSLWDGCLVQLVNGETCTSFDQTYTALARKLAQWAKEPSAAAFKPTGDHRRWAAQWATDSLRAAIGADAYALTLINARVQASHGGEEHLQATIAFPAKHAYAKARTKAARDQLVKATVRLAELFNSIQWP